MINGIDVTSTLTASEAKLEERLQQFQKRAATTCDMERLHETQFGDLNAMLETDEARINVECAIANIKKAVEYLTCAGALSDDHRLAEVSAGLTDEASNLRAVCDCLREKTGALK